MICTFGGLRAPFLLVRTRDWLAGPCHQTTPLHRRLVMLLLWLSLSPSGWAGESEPAKEAKVIPKISLNVQQGPTGLSLAPTLQSDQSGAVTFALDLWSQGAGGAVISARAGGRTGRQPAPWRGTTESGTGLSLSGKNTVAAVAGGLVAERDRPDIRVPLISMISRLDCLFIQ